VAWGVARTAWSAATAGSAALVAGAVVLLALSWDAPVPDAWGFRGYAILQAAAFTAVGAFIAIRRSGNAIGWLLLAAGALNAVEAFAIQYAEFTIVGGHPEWPFGVVSAWIASWIWAPVESLILPVVLLRFPDGRLLSPRLRGVEWFAGVTAAGLASYMALKPGPLQLAAFADNPFAVDQPVLLGVLIGLGTVGFLTIVMAALSVIVRFRRSSGIERLQLKWLAFSVLPLGATGIASAVLPDKIGQVLYVLVAAFVPIAIGIAILRYRLYDIDVLINRALVYGATTAMIGVAFFAGIVVIQAILRPLTGGSEVAVAASTLLSFALFQPLRHRIQGVVDRRFFRSRYDAVRILDSFTSRLRDEVDLDAVRADLVDAAHRTVQPVHANVWLRERVR